MALLSISKAWDESKLVFVRDSKLLIPVTLALIVLPQILATTIAPNPEDVERQYYWPMLFTAIAGLVGQIALILMGLGTSTSVGAAIRHGLRRTLSAIAVMLLLFLMLVVLAVPFAVVAALAGVAVPAPGAPASGSLVLLAVLVVIAALLIFVRFMMTFPVLTAETADPIAAIRRSWALTGSNYWRLLGFAILLLIAMVVLLSLAAIIGGILARLVGSEIEPFSGSALILGIASSLAQGAFTLLSSIMLARIYVQLSGGGAAEASVPHTGG